jgi:glutamine amidotransferase
MKLALIDYGSGNLRSVQKALEVCGGKPELVSSPEALADAQALVVPGVGSFGDCAANLRRTGLWEPIKEWIRAEKPFLGICLGYQLLFEGSAESPGVEGLSVLSGRVRRFDSGGIKIPHIGWNTLDVADGPAGTIYRGISNPISVYFVHSYFPEPEDRSIISASCNYGSPFAASITRGNLHGVQFHPEKSQRTGLAILTNFVNSL